MFSVEIDEVDREAMFSGLDRLKAEPQGDGALLKNDRNLFGPNGIKGSQDIKLSLLVRGGIAETKDFDVNDGLLY